MTATHHALRRWVDMCRGTPLHPQWLLGRPEHLKGWLHRCARGVVVDVGCANRWVERSLPAGCTYIGVDYWTTGRKMYSAKPDVFGDAARLPLPSASVDTVVLFEVMEHLRDPDAAASEIRRILRPDGTLLLTMPFLYPIHDAPYDYQRLTLHGLKRTLSNAGLAIEEVEESMSAAESAGLLLNLALSGLMAQAVAIRHPALVFAPLLAILMPLINMGAWLSGRLLPSWPAFTAGYRVRAVCE